MGRILPRAALVAEGLSNCQIQEELEAGQLHRIRRGFYTDGQSSTAAAQHLLAVRAASRAMHPGAVFSHLSAAVLHELPLPPRLATVRVEYTRAGSSGGRRGSVGFLHKAPLAGDVVTIDGMPTTSLWRTAADLSRTWPKEDALALVDAALRRGLEPGQLLTAVNARPCRGNATARWVVRFADPRSESYYESLVRLRMHEQSLPAPLLQHPIADRHGELLGVTDFAWPDLGVLGEFDGAVKYGELRAPGQTPEQVLMREKRREERICQQGWWFARFTASDCHRPDGIRRIWEEAVLARRRGLGQSATGWAS